MGDPSEYLSHLTMQRESGSTPPPDRLPSSSSLDTEEYSPVSMVEGSTWLPYLQPTTVTSCDPASSFLSLKDSLSSFEAQTSSGSLKLPQVISSSSALSEETEPSFTSPRERCGGKPTAIRANRNVKEVGRRQKRLERNRESARLSRRRRKFYLEELEERVNQLSDEMEQGRRQHVSIAVETLESKRSQILQDYTPAEQTLDVLETGLNRTSGELKIAGTFLAQQVKSFTLDSAAKFVLWMTLQNDAYFRGGRAASERLSAARIGERMLSNGTSKVTPAQSMWPLLCNEIGLSYDQEEKVRVYQRTLLQTHESWLERHTAHSTTRVVQSQHDATKALALRLGQRETSTMSILSPDQKGTFAVWATNNKDRLLSKTKDVQGINNDASDKYHVATDQHVAANLYILNHRFENILQAVPPAAPLVTGLALKKLSRRPSFESLGCREGTDKSHEFKMSREDSFASSGSLKRSASDISMDNGDERPIVASISPEGAQASAYYLVEQTIGGIMEIIPLPPTPTPYAVSSAALPAPTTVTSMTVPSFQFSTRTQYQSEPNLSMHHQDIASGQQHKRNPSFLPPHLNVVPEEIWPAEGTEGAEDFLMDLVEGDWAIGEGVYMEF